MMQRIRFGLAIAAIAFSTPAFAQNIVVNGGFETGNFSGWTQFGNTGFANVNGVFGGVAPVEGTAQASFGPIGSAGGIFQSLSTTAGSMYSYSFSLGNFGGTPNSFVASIAGAPVVSISDGASPYTQYQGIFTASGSATDLRFAFQQDPSFFLFDAVSVSAITSAAPEPATWAMMIGGFGMAGGALRRRRLKVRIAYA